MSGLRPLLPQLSQVEILSTFVWLQSDSSRCFLVPFFRHFFTFENGFIKCFVGSEEGTPDSVNPSVVDDDEEEGLPSPPLDEGAFFVTQAGSMELSQVFALHLPPFYCCKLLIFRD